MEQATTSTRIIFLRAAWQTWTGIAATLFAWRFAVVSRSSSTTLTQAGRTILVIGVGALLGSLLKLLLQAAPLAVRVDYQFGLVTLYKLGWPWKISLPLADVRCQLNRQTSHSGVTHYLVVYGQQGQVWSVQQSSWWPLGQLEQLQQLLSAQAT